jgi:hypothetical protein
MLVGAQFKKFGLFLNTLRICPRIAHTERRFLKCNTLYLKIVLRLNDNATAMQMSHGSSHLITAQSLPVHSQKGIAEKDRKFGRI